MLSLSNSDLSHPSPQIPRSPHQLLVLVLLHFQLPLPLHTDQHHAPLFSAWLFSISPSLPELLPLLAPNPHPPQKGLLHRHLRPHTWLLPNLHAPRVRKTCDRCG